MWNDFVLYPKVTYYNIKIPHVENQIAGLTIFKITTTNAEITLLVKKNIDCAKWQSESRLWLFFGEKLSLK